MPTLDTARCNVFIVPETHWDRAWYLPFEQYRRKLVQFLDRLLGTLERDPAFACFVADGQTVVIEDYLQVRPERRAALERRVKAGRLKIGPWCVLPDEFIVSGESLVRNLFHGMAQALALGGVMRVGYVPDPFGHVGQLPQILQGFGIDTFIFSRGVLAEQTDVEFLWQAPDGTQVLALHQRGFYNNAAFLGYPIGWGEPERMVFSMKDALTQIEQAVEALAGRTHTRAYLLNNGVDHSEHQPELPRIVERARRKWPRARIRIAGFDDYVAAARGELKGKPLAVKAHELTYPFSDLLRGVYSARVYLKQANQQCETLLGAYAEPLEALAERCKPGRHDERALLGYTWRELLKNHPHDDICGCSVDAVHRDMMNRFARVEQVGWAIAGEALRDIANAMDHTAQPGVPMVLYNPTAHAREGAQQAHLLFELNETAFKDGRFRLVDAAGRPVAFEWLGAREMNWMEMRKQFTMWVAEVALDAGALPPCGFKTLYVQPLAKGARPARPAARVRVTRSALENEFLKVRVTANGTYTLTDKATGAVYPGLGLFEDVEDCGDEYNWSDLEAGSQTLTTTDEKAVVEIAQRGPLLARLRLTHALKVPAALTHDRKARSARLVELTLVTELTLRAGARRLEVKTTVDNQAHDHRLRVLFPTPFSADMVQAGGHFDTVERPVDPTGAPQYLAEHQWPLYPTEHFAGFVRLGDKRRGLAVLAKGLCEYEAIEKHNGSPGHKLALTLLRAVGWLSRGDFHTRPFNAGPQIAAPEAQMQGVHTFEYALYPHKGDWTKARLAQEAQELARPVLCERGDRHGTSIVPEQAERTQPIPREGTLPETFSLLALEPGELVLSALKRSETGKEWIVRLYNQSPRQVRGRLKLGFPARGVWRADLSEQKTDARPFARGREIELTVPGKKIVTLAVKF